MIETILNNETSVNALELAMKIRQVRQEKRGSSSSRRPMKKKRLIKRDQQEAHDRLYKDYFTEYSIYNETHFWHRF